MRRRIIIIKSTWKSYTSYRAMSLHAKTTSYYDVNVMSSFQRNCDVTVTSFKQCYDFIVRQWLDIFCYQATSFARDERHDVICRRHGYKVTNKVIKYTTMTSKLHRQSDVTLTSQYDVVTSWIAVTLAVATGTESN